MKKRTFIIFAAGITLLLLLMGVYAGVALYYEDHFLENTTVNGCDVSGMTAEEAEKLIAENVEDYDLTVTTKEGSQEVITGDAIGYRYVSGDEISSFLNRQVLLSWPLSLLGKQHAFEIKVSFAYEEKLLKKAVKELACMQEENVTEPQDAHLEQRDGVYVVVPEVEGNKLGKKRVLQSLKRAVDGNARSVNLTEAGCYLEPKVRAAGSGLQEEAALWNKYTSITVTYRMGGGKTVVLDSKTISGWFSLNKKKKPVFDQKAITAWVNQLADQYDTIGTVMPFVTSRGETVQVEAKTYGWQINRKKEAEALRLVLLQGESTERSPWFYESAFARGDNDVGDTYVEIDYTNQRMWYYKDGELLVETPVVTGNVSNGTGSPEGYFCVVDKQRNATLKGEGYERPVSYWMPFWEGVGIHDANAWRQSYGGKIYQYGGSHGCINTPDVQAEVIYRTIGIGTPVVCYSSARDYGYGETAVGEITVSEAAKRAVKQAEEETEDMEGTGQ